MTPPRSSDDFLGNFGLGNSPSLPNPTKTEDYDEEAYWDEEVAPLMKQLKEKMEARNLPLLVFASFGYQEGQGYHVALGASLRNSTKNRVPPHFPLLFNIAQNPPSGVVGMDLE